MVNGFLAGAAGGAVVSIVIQAVDNFSKVFAGVNKTMAATGIAITALGVAGLAVSKGLVNTAASFESAFTGVRKTVELTEKEFAKLRQEFKNLSKETPIAFEELSAIGEIAGQLGVEGVDNITKFTETIAAISVSTNLSAEQAATDFARIANVMQEPLENVDRMGSAVVGLGNNFATTEAEITTFAQRIAGAGNIAGLTTPDILAIGAAMSSVGVQAEAGGTAVQKVLIGINTAVVTSSEELEIFAKTAGKTTDEFAKLWKEDAGKAFEEFVVGLGTQGDEAIITLKDLGLEDQRLVRSFLSLSNAGDVLTNTLATSQSTWQENIALTDEAAKRYATTESQVAILKNKFASLKDDMGQLLIPTFIKLVDILGKVIGWLEKHPTLTKFAVAALAIGSALAIVVGPLLILVAMLPALSVGFGMLSAATIPITGTILAIAAAVTAVIAGIVLLISWLKRLKGEKEESIQAAQDEFDRQNNNSPGTSGNGSRDRDDTIDLNRRRDDRDDTIYLNGNISNNPDVISLNDFILTPNGDIIKPSPQDTIIGTKTPGSMGGNISISIENINGVDPDEIAAALASEIKKVIRL